MRDRDGNQYTDHADVQEERKGSSLWEQQQALDRLQAALEEEEDPWLVLGLALSLP